MSNININELSTRDQNELSSSKILFWNFIKELYLPDKPFSFYIKLVNQINKEILINENFRELVKNEIFSKFFNAILHYIFKELDKKPLFPLANEEDFVNLRDFLQIYQHSSLSLLDEMHKNNVFPLLNHKEQHFILTPAYIEQNMKIIHFFVGLERKKIRKEFKNIETYEEFSKETLEFLKENKDSDQIFEISNFFFNGTCKWIKKVMFLKDIDVKAKALVRIIVILEQFIIDNKKEIKRNLKCFEILRSHSFVELKKTLKLRFWSRFQENSLEKPKAYDENYQKNMFVVPFLELYDVIKEFLDNNFGIFILEMSFLIYIKVNFFFFVKKLKEIWF